jgi:hypothetical protein
VSLLQALSDTYPLFVEHKVVAIYERNQRMLKVSAIVRIELLATKEEIPQEPFSNLLSLGPVECWRRSNFDPPCRPNFDPGLIAGRWATNCG